MGLSSSLLNYSITEASSLLSSDEFYKITGIRIRFFKASRTHHFRTYKNKIQVLQDFDSSATKELGFISFVDLRKAVNIGHYIIANFQLKQETANEDGLCCICLDKNLEILLPCGHGYCEKDILDWQHQQKNCPMCRQSVYSNKMFLSIESFKDENDLTQMLGSEACAVYEGNNPAYYCDDIVLWPVASDVQESAWERNKNAYSLYYDLKTRYLNTSDPDAPSLSCLAVAREFFCAYSFPYCLDDVTESHRGVCSFYCDDIWKSRCPNEEYDKYCSNKVSTHCSFSQTILAALGILFIA